MTSLEKRTILLNTVFNFGSVLVANFISVYLYIYTSSIPLMCLYIIVRIGLFPVFFICGNALSKKYSFTVTYTIGLILITTALVYALLGGPLFDENPYYVLIAAAIIGTGEGFYYFSANTMNQIASDPENRARFFSYNGIFGNITSLMAPLYANLILGMNESEIVGYERILLTIIMIFIGVVFVALRINKHSEDKGSSVKKALSMKDPVWRRHNIGVMFYGLRNALELNTISLLIYRACTNSIIYSRLQAVFAAIMIVSYRVIIRFLKKDRINRTFKIGVIVKIVSTLILLFVPTVTGAIAYGVINACATVIYDNSYNIQSANVISLYREEMTARVVARETYLSLARCVAMGFIILCYKLIPGDMYLTVSVVLLAFMPIPTYLFMKNSDN